MRRYKLHDKCPGCGGTGQTLEHGDAHRSTGMVPCRWRNETFECYRGKLGRTQFSKPSKVKKRII
jgi:hypothetical protein